MNIATWNMQGLMHQGDSTYTEARNRMLMHNIDVLCLQESGDLSQIGLNYVMQHLGIFLYDDIIGTTSRGFGVYVYFFQNGRCSLAILAKKTVVSNNYIYPIPYYISMSNGVVAPRPIIGIYVQDRGGNFRIYNMHSIASSDKANEYNTRVIDYLRQNRNFNLSYVLAGDFNSVPGNLMSYFQAPPFPLMSNTNPNIFNPNEATHNSGKELDYFETNLNRTLQVTMPDDNIAYSDHRLVMATL